MSRSSRGKRLLKVLKTQDFEKKESGRVKAGLTHVLAGEHELEVRERNSNIYLISTPRSLGPTMLNNEERAVRCISIVCCLTVTLSV